jgi:hypothetical protein
MDIKTTYRSSQYLFYTAMGIIVLVYLLFPGNNSFSEDSFAYANNVKYGEDLFWPHHLLYSAFNYVLFTLSKQVLPWLDAYRFMQLLNGVFALLSLLILYKTIRLQSGNADQARVWTFFVASCFGVIRFAVEVETYIIPVFFSLLSSFYYLRYLQTKKSGNVLLCSLFASIACLFHQIHLFWGIGLFLGFLRTKNIKHILLYSLPTLSVLVVYSCVMVFYAGIDFSFQHLCAYLFDYYYSDDANIAIGVSNFVLTPISFFRTFFQMHGIIVDILQLIPLFWAVIPMVVILLGVGLFRLKDLRFKRSGISQSEFEYTHLIIFVLQFGFAFFSHGNAEFMVMLPFLIPLFVYVFVEFNLRAVNYFSIAMLVWNFCFSVFPNNHFDYYNDERLIEIIKDNPDKAFILSQRNVIVEKYYYATGSYEDDRLIHEYRTEDILRLQQEDKVFYTDILTKKMPFSRASITNHSEADKLLFIQHIVRIDSDLGGFYVDEVEIRRD